MPSTTTIHVAEFATGWYVWEQDQAGRLVSPATGPFPMFGPCKAQALALKGKRRIEIIVSIVPSPHPAPAAASTQPLMEGL